MAGRYVCPEAVAITDIPNATCLEDFGQEQRLAFQRTFSAPGVKNTFPATGVGEIGLIASWDVFLAAADSTKVQVTGDVEDPATEPGAARTVGGGNATLGGSTKNRGSEPTSKTYMLNAYRQATVKAMKEYQGELSLSVFLFNEFGQIGCLADDPENPTAYYPIPILKQTLFIGDKKLGELEEEDANAMTFQFKQNWSDNFVVVTPTDFDPLTDLVNP